MKTALIYLWLVAYPACGDAIYEKLTGPFQSQEVCEQYMTNYARTRGPAAPGSIYKCEAR
mgnify:CR=1 FL=1